MKTLATHGDGKTFEDLWLSAIEDSTIERAELLESLDMLRKKGEKDRTATMGWTWLTTLKDQVEPAEALELGRSLLLCCGDSNDLRSDVLDLYRQVYADRDELETLIDASGMAGEKSPRRALRTLETCLNLKIGDFLIDRESEKVAQVTAIDADLCEYTLMTARGERSYDPDSLALAFDPVEPNDFRVLTQQRQETLQELIKSDPAALVIGVLKSRHDLQIDSDRLETLLTPTFIPADKYKGWWTKARSAMRRNPHVVLEGRNPLMLTYHAEGQSLEEEIEPQWDKAGTPAERLTVIETYLREAKARKIKPAPGLVKKMERLLTQRVNVCRKGSASEALAEALVLDRLSEQLSENAASAARDILTDSKDTKTLLSNLKEPRLYQRAIDLLCEVMPDRWQETYLELLPISPQESCDTIAERLTEAERLEDLKAVVQAIPEDMGAHLNAVCWLWRGPSVEALEPIPRNELLPRILEYLNNLTLHDNTPAETLREARTRIRAALSAAQYAQYRKVIDEMEPGLASTIYRTVDRMQGLGQVVYSTLKRIVRDAYPKLFVKATVDPWIDDDIIFSTRQGIDRYNKELHHLLHVKIPENAKAIGEAASHGDLSENSEFKFALEERDLLQSRASRMQKDLSRAQVLTSHDISTEQVGLGTRVTLVAEDGHGPLSLTILGPWEADSDKQIYNYRAPLCSKLRGLTVGENVALHLDDTERIYRVQSIENALAEESAG